MKKRTQKIITTPDGKNFKLSLDSNTSDDETEIATLAFISEHLSYQIEMLLRQISQVTEDLTDMNQKLSALQCQKALFQTRLNKKVYDNYIKKIQPLDKD